MLTALMLIIIIFVLGFVFLYMSYQKAKTTGETKTFDKWLINLFKGPPAPMD